MKKILSSILVIAILLIVGGIKVEASDLGVSEVQDMIDAGEAITDPSSAEAYVWISNVLKLCEKHKDSYIYNDMKKDANSAKGNSSISIFNYQNKILGYLRYLKNELNDSNSKDIDDLIVESNSIGSLDAPEAYLWVVDVRKNMDQYTNYSLAKGIANDATSAQSNSSISIFNKYNIILGCLLHLNEVIQGYNDNLTISSIEELINEGNSITDWSSSDAYRWLLRVSDFNQLFPESSVYSSLSSRCSSAQSNSSISIFNYNNLILADLMVLQDELEDIDTLVLNRIEITNPPQKTVYNDGELFDSKGLIVSAIYIGTNKDNSTFEKKKKISSYTFDAETPIAYGDTEWIISYSEGEITKTVAQPIEVNPIIISETLKSISIAKAPKNTSYKEGECFLDTGMRVDAIYDQQLSDGSHTTIKKENVSYIVDSVSKLTADVTSVTVTVKDGDITLSIEQPISVESYILSTLLDSIVVVKNPNKVSYIAGEKFDKTGMVINARYKCEWSNGYIEYITNENISTYSVNTSSPLKAGMKKMTISYIDGGIKKTVDIPITVVAKTIDDKNTTASTDNTEKTTEKKTETTNKENSDFKKIDKVTSLTVKAKKGKKILVSFKKVKNAKGYQVQYSLNNKFTKKTKSITLKSQKKKSVTINNLKKGNTYYVRVRAYKTVGNKKIYGKWSVVKKIKVKN